MKKVIVLISAIVLVASGLAFAGGKAHWTYSGHEGPENWGSLDESYHMCGEGRNQSPIDLQGFVEADLAPITFDYESGATEILNNGHTVQVNYAPGSTITVDGHTFELKQFHFHAPSENLIEGKSFAMEGHLVHADKDGNLAVVAVMLDEGSTNALLATLWESMPEKAETKNALKGDLNAESLLPANRDYFRFNGSLTTPPCTEGVEWLVMKNAVTASDKQVKEFEHVMHHPNNRPVQSANARPVLK